MIIVIFVFLFIHDSYHTDTTTPLPEPCICDNSAVTGNGACSKSTDEDGKTVIKNCGCKDPNAKQTVSMMNKVFVVCCDICNGTYEKGLTSTTTVSPDYEDLLLMTGNCTSGFMEKSVRDINKYIYIAAAVYILIWVVITIAVNLKHKNKGAHRSIHLFEEIIIVLLYVAMGPLNFMLTNSKTACIVVTCCSHFFMTMLCGCFLMEGIFASTMVNNKSRTNGSMPTVLNFILPIFLGLIPALATYFLQDKYYAISGIHCFASVFSNMFWGFVIPPWLLIFFMSSKTQSAFLQCKKVKSESDVNQVYWGYKSTKSLLLFALFVYTIYLTIMFGGDLQKFWLLIIGFVLTIILGPTIFVVHTYCHINSAVKIHPKLFGFYTPCPEEIKEEHLSVDDDPDSDEEPEVLPPAVTEPAETPTAIPETESEPTPGEPTKPIEKDPESSPKESKTKHAPVKAAAHTSSQKFYEWLQQPTGGDVQSESLGMLFRPTTR